MEQDRQRKNAGDLERYMDCFDIVERVPDNKSVKYVVGCSKIKTWCEK